MPTFENIEALINNAAEAAKEAQDVDQYLLDYSKPIDKPVPVIVDPTNQERIVLSEGNILAIAGEAKSYKSFCASRLVIDFFQQNQRPEDKVVIVDTEQADWNVANVAHRICKGLFWKYEEALASGRLLVYRLRPLKHSERLKVTQAIVEQKRPRLIVIDGIRDLIHGINDDEACTDLLDELMRWNVEYATNIITVLHTNKDGETLRGHLGSELQNKAETVLFCKKRDEGRGATVSSKYARNIDIDTFELEIDAQYVPQRVEKPRVVVEMKCGTPRQTKALQALHVKTDSRQLWLQDIRTAGGVMQDTAERWFDQYVAAGYLIPTDGTLKKYEHFLLKHSTPQPTSATIDATAQEFPMYQAPDNNHLDDKDAPF